MEDMTITVLLGFEQKVWFFVVGVDFIPIIWDRN